MKLMINFFLSLKTLLGLFIVFIALALTGSLKLTDNLAFFSGIDDTPLFIWLADSGNLKLTWWIYLMILLFGVLAINTIFCAVDALLKKSGWKNIMVKLTPQIMHIGVLFVMLGHLLTASLGFKMDMLIEKGEKKAVTATTAVSVDEIRIQTDNNGYHTGWEITLSWFENGRKTADATLRPLHPVYFGQLGLFSKSVVSETKSAAILRICRDPGSLWALLGGITLAFGGVVFLFGKYRGPE